MKHATRAFTFTFAATLALLLLSPFFLNAASAQQQARRAPFRAAAHPIQNATSEPAAQVPQFSRSFIVSTGTEASDESITLTAGFDPDATDGIDAQFGETELPSPPPTGGFDVRFGKTDGTGPLGNGTRTSIIEGTAPRMNPDSDTYLLSAEIGDGTTLYTDSILVSFDLDPNQVDSVNVQDALIGLLDTTLTVQAGPQSGGFELPPLVSAFTTAPVNLTIYYDNATADPGAGLVFNEFLADPNGDVDTDLNGDGTADSGDEFLELYNAGSSTTDLGDLSLEDAAGNSYDFPDGTSLGAGEYAVIMGDANGKTFGAFTDSGVTSLNNGGDTISLLDADGNEITSLSYAGSEAYEGVSAARNPNGSGSFERQDGFGEMPNETAGQNNETGEGNGEPEAFATVTFNDQTSPDGLTVTVASVTIPQDGYVAIHDSTLLGPDGTPFTSDDQPLSSVIGVSDYLTAGSYTDLSVTLFDVPGLNVPADTSLLVDQTLIAMPHQETGGADPMEYNFLTSDGAVDVPYFNANGNPVVDPGFVTIGGVADNTAPVCGDITVTNNGDGQLASVELSPTDEQSGISTVEFTTLDNLEGFVDTAGPFSEGDVFTTPTPNPTTVTITADRQDFTEGGAIVTTVTNGAGLSAQCDPAVEQLASDIPGAFALKGNYPNPFRRQTTIEFKLPEAASVTIEVYDMLGRKVATLVDEEMAASTYQLQWDGTGQSGQPLASGVYVYRIKAGDHVASRKLTLIR